METGEKKRIKQFQVRRVKDQTHPSAPVGCEAGELLKVKAVAFSELDEDGEKGMFALSTAGVVAPPFDPGEDAPPDHPDKGGGLMLFNCGDGFFDADPDCDSAAFVSTHFMWEKKDSNEVIDDIKFSPSSQYLAAASHDNVIYVYDLQAEEGGPRLHTKCRGHSSYISHIDWAVGSDMLLSNSGDYELLYWELNTQATSFVLTPKTVRDAEWASWSGVLGFDVMGIWQDGMDGTDYNAMHRSTNGKFCVGSTDDGLVRLFNYPAVIEKAPHHSFRGHSSHVQNVRFLGDDARVISAGGRDGSMLQWTTHGITAPSKSKQLKKVVKEGKRKVAAKTKARRSS